MPFSLQLLVIAAFTAFSGFGAMAADSSQTFQGTITYSSASEGTLTYTDTLVFTTHTYGNQTFAPEFETRETVGEDVGYSVFTNPVALQDGSGYVFDMSATIDGQFVGNLGHCFVAYGTPGHFTSFVFNKCRIANADGLFQTGSGTFSKDSSGRVTFVRNEKEVDASGNVLESIVSTDTLVNRRR